MAAHARTRARAVGAALICILAAVHYVAFRKATVKLFVEVDGDVQAADVVEELVEPLESSWKRSREELDMEDARAVRAFVARSAEEALQRLEREPIPCIPAVCESPIHFRDRGDGEQSFIIASVPGSGNTWMRTIMRYGTRLYTGSIYKDSSLVRAGFKGEPLKPQDRRTALVKSHFPANPTSQPPIAWANGAVHIIRAPFDAHVADCNRYYGHGHTQVLGPKRLSNCVQFAMRKSRGWRKSMRFYERPVSSDPDAAGPEAAMRSRSSIVYIKYLDKNVTGGRDFPVISMFYEDFVRDFTRATAHLFAALALYFPGQFPTIHESVLCVAHAAAKLEKAYRKPRARSQQNIFRNETHTHEFARSMCADKYAEFWNEGRWGPCDGTLQRDRAAPVARRLELPDAVCTT